MSIRLMSQVWEDTRIESQAELLVLSHWQITLVMMGFAGHRCAPLLGKPVSRSDQLKE